MFGLSPPPEHLWASHLALQTSTFLLFNVGREPNPPDAQGSGRERSAPPGNFVSSAKPGPPSAGAGARSAGAWRRRSSFPSTSRGPLGALQSPAEGEQLSSRASRRGGGGGPGGGGGGSQSPPPPRDQESAAQLAAPPQRLLHPRGPRARGSPRSLS